MNTKTIAAALIAPALAISLAACGSTDATKTESAASTSAPTVAVTQTSAPATNPALADTDTGSGDPDYSEANATIDPNTGVQVVAYGLDAYSPGGSIKARLTLNGGPKKATPSQRHEFNQWQNTNYRHVQNLTLEVSNVADKPAPTNIIDWSGGVDADGQMSECIVAEAPNPDAPEMMPADEIAPGKTRTYHMQCGVNADGRLSIELHDSMSYHSMFARWTNDPNQLG